MRDLDDINHRWGVRHVITLLVQCIQLAVGISQIIHEVNICSTSDADLLECENITLWQHVCTGTTLVVFYLDFYGICFCDIDMLTHIHSIVR